MVGLAAVLTLAGSSVVLALPGSGDAASIDQMSAAQGAQVVSYWTPARMASATPEGPARTTAPVGSIAKLMPTSHPYNGIPTVGALFYTDATHHNHYCTASVVNSPHHNFVVTAAHCIHSGARGAYKTHIAFVPMYHNHLTPYGVWPAHMMTVPLGWRLYSDPDLDFGFVALFPKGRSNVGDLVGWNQLATYQNMHQYVYVSGYPSVLDQPIACSNWSLQVLRYQMRFDCRGFTTGTSGGPWLSHYNAKTRRGWVMGVIGGYQKGGNTPDISYSAYFDHDIQNLHDSLAKIA